MSIDRGLAEALANMLLSPILLRADALGIANCSILPRQ
jgi:hypothetical protein